jgi:hypothetical protein
MVFYATFSSISVLSRRPALLEKKTRVPGENLIVLTLAVNRKECSNAMNSLTFPVAIA